MLALGANEASLIKMNNYQNIFEVVSTVNQIMSESSFDLILTGQQGAGAHGVGPTLSSLTGTTLVTAAILLEDLNDGKAVTTRTLGKGQRQKVTFPFPALVMCDRTMDIEDHSSIPNLLRASKIKIKEHENVKPEHRQ